MVRCQGLGLFLPHGTVIAHQGTGASWDSSPIWTVDRLSRSGCTVAKWAQFRHWIVSGARANFIVRFDKYPAAIGVKAQVPDHNSKYTKKTKRATMAYYAPAPYYHQYGTTYFLIHTRMTEAENRKLDCLWSFTWSRTHYVHWEEKRD